MSESILSIEQVAERTPWSRSTLYRIASREDSPFRKVAGRWVTTEGDLVDWVRRSPVAADDLLRKLQEEAG